MLITCTRPASVLDTRAGLLAELAVIDEEGWDGPAAEHLLGYVRSHIVRPQVVEVGLCGPVADQAEATGWAAAWETLAGTSIRTARTPWGLLWVAVRRAILGEIVAASYGCGARNGWRVHSLRQQSANATSVSCGVLEPPVSLTVLVEGGWEPAASGTGTGDDLGRHLEAVVSSLVRAGWQQTLARDVVEAVALTAVRDGKTSTAAQGWRPVARRLGVAPWQVRRVMVLLLGAPGWPGLIERMMSAGREVLDDPGIGAAVRSTVLGWWPPPPVAASRAQARAARTCLPVAC